MKVEKCLSRRRWRWKRISTVSKWKTDFVFFKVLSIIFVLNDYGSDSALPEVQCLNENRLTTPPIYPSWSRSSDSQIKLCGLLVGFLKSATISYKTKILSLFHEQQNIVLSGLLDFSPRIWTRIWTLFIFRLNLYFLSHADKQLTNTNTNTNSNFWQRTIKINQSPDWLSNVSRQTVSLSSQKCQDCTF